MRQIPILLIVFLSVFQVKANTDSGAVASILRSVGIDQFYWNGVSQSSIDSLVKWRSGRITELDLSSLDLFKPGLDFSSLAKLDSLETLNIEGSMIGRVPESITGLSNLKYLNLSTCNIRELDGISSLKGLERLFLIGNRFESELPLEICQLPELKILVLRASKIFKLPECIGELKQLEYLDLSYNSLSTFPPAFAQLRSLNLLNFNNNQFNEFPKEVLHLQNLVQLLLGRNSLDSLPSDIHNLNKLSVLHLYENNLTQLPSSLMNLNSLTWILLYGNNLCNLSKEMLDYLKDISTNIKNICKASGIEPIQRSIIGSGLGRAFYNLNGRSIPSGVQYSPFFD